MASHTPLPLVEDPPLPAGRRRPKKPAHKPGKPGRPLTTEQAKREADAQREVLRELALRRGMTIKSYARWCGVAPSAFSNFMNGYTHGFNQVTLERIAKREDGLTIDEISGAASRAAGHNVLTQPVYELIVKAHAVLGVAQSKFTLPVADWERAVVPVTAQQMQAGAFGLKIMGPDQHYPVGTVLVCLPWHSYTGRLVAGRCVVLRKTLGDGAGVEVSVRQLHTEMVRTPDGRVRVSRLVDGKGRYVPMPWPFEGQVWRHRQQRCRIGGVVVGSYTLEDQELER